MHRNESNIEEHARLGPDRLKTPIFGRFALSLLVVLILSAIFSKLTVPYPGYVAFGAVVIGELLLLWRRMGKFKKALGLQQELDRLKEQEFDLRFEEAKLSGQLDRWSGKDE